MRSGVRGRLWVFLGVVVVVALAGCGGGTSSPSSDGTTRDVAAHGGRTRACGLLTRSVAEHLAGLADPFAVTSDGSLDECQFVWPKRNAFVLLTHPPVNPSDRSARGAIQNGLATRGARAVRGVGSRAWERTQDGVTFIEWSREDTLSALQVMSPAADRRAIIAFARTVSKAY